MSTSATPDKVVRYIDGLNDRFRPDDPSACGTLGELGENAAPTSLTSGEDPLLASLSTTEGSLFGLIELLLKNPRRLDAAVRLPQVQRELVPRLLTIGLVGYSIFAAVLAVVFSCAGVWPELTAMAVWLESPGQPLIRAISTSEGASLSRWVDGSALHLMAAFAIGLVGAIGICLPSFYFYSLLAGVQTTMLHVTTAALKGLASGALALLGALPIYLAAMLGLVVFSAPADVVETACFFGLTLPFIAGLHGSRSLYIGFLGLSDTLPEARRCRRTCFLRRLLLAWCGCYTAVTPVMILALWEYMSR